MSSQSQQSSRAVSIPATDKQRLAWIVWEDEITDDLVFGGSAGGGKSMVAGQLLTSTALKHPGSKQFLGRKELKTLMQTSYITLTQKVFPQYGLRHEIDWHLDGKYNVIKFRNGSTIDLLDLAYVPSDSLYDRFGSSEYTRGWIEEASEVAFKAYDVLKSRIGRWMNTEKGIKSKLGLSLNPSQDWPYRVFYNVWRKAGRPTDPKNPLVSIRAIADGKEITRTFVFIAALYNDNPFTVGEYSKSLATIQDPVLKQRLMMGDWEYSSAKDTMFTASIIADIFTNVPEFSNQLFMIVDVARLGKNETVLSIFRGWDCFKVIRKAGLRIPKSAELIRTSAQAYGVPASHILIDEDGVGGGVLDLVEGAIGFHGGAAPFGKVGEKKTRENYENLKSQCAYHLAKIATDKLLCVSETDLETRELISQDLAQIKRRDPEGDKLRIVRKEDVIDSLGRSPDCGDTLLMRSYFDLRERDDELRESTGVISVHIPDMDV